MYFIPYLLRIFSLLFSNLATGLLYTGVRLRVLRISSTTCPALLSLDFSTIIAFYE
jgi:hypothetical protein